MVYNFKNIERIVEEENICKTHSFYAIASNILESKNLLNEDLRVESSRVTSLNGKWDFVFTDSTDISFDSELIEFKKINVPSCWEKEFSLGYKYIQGIQFEMGLTSNIGSSGVYKRTFQITDLNKKYFVEFNKVNGLLQLFINGKYVGLMFTGYGEFDITEFLVEGENEIFCSISKNNNTETANCTDREAISGITGDVFLISRPKKYISNYSFSSYVSGANHVAKFVVETNAEANTKIELKIYDRGVEVADFISRTDENGIATFESIDEYKTYSSENPNLYDVCVGLFEEEDIIEGIKFKIGFSEIKFENGEFKYCDLPVKLKAVTLSSEYDVLGNVLNRETYIDLINNLDALNINTIYVNTHVEPIFFTLCAIKGLYVVENLPISTKYIPKIYGDNYKKLAYESIWYKRTLETRANEIVLRDNNFTSLLFFTTNVDETGCVAYKEVIQTARAISNKPILDDTGNFVVVDLAYAIKNRQNIWGMLSDDTKSFFIVNVVPKINISLQDLDSFINNVIARQNAIGLSVNCLYREMGNNSIAEYLIDSNYSFMPAGSIVKYAYRPIESHFISSNCLRLTNRFVFKDTSDIVVRIFKGKVGSRVLLGEFSPKIDPLMSKDYDINIPAKYDTPKVFVEYDYISGKHIATEPVNTLREDETIGEKYNEFASYTYTFNNKFEQAEPYENILKPRAFFVPNATKTSCDRFSRSGEKTISDRLSLISGEWDVAYFENGCPEQFTPNAIQFKKVITPSTFESIGLEKHSYVKDGYPFKSDLNKFSVNSKDGRKNSAAIYRKIISLGDLNYNYILTFDKVNGVFELQVNGKYVGYSTIGFGEFDISQFITVGLNEIVVIVKKWSSSSYLFDLNNGFQATGIVGDVYYTKVKKSSLFDVEYDAFKDINDFFVNINLKFFEANKQTVVVELNDGDNNLYTKCINKLENDTVKLPISYNFEPYNVETQKTYQLYIKVYEKGLLCECSKISLGFNSVKLQADLLSINDEDIKLHGIEYNPIYNKDGNILTQYDYADDLSLIKAYGFNTIIPTNYISVDALDYCYKKAGLYVIKDLGFNTISNNSDPKTKYNVIRSEKFEKVVEEVALYTYSRTKNNPAIIAYYFNESLSEKPIAQIAKELREKASRPICSLEGEDTDIVVARKLTVGALKTILDINTGVKPVIVSGYGSSSGLGNPQLKDYEYLINTWDCCCGGAIHQFVDDVVGNNVATTEGIFNEDRLPYPVANEVKHLFRSVVSVISDDNKTISFENRNFNLNADYLYADVCIYKNGHILSRTRLNINVPPRKTQSYDLFVGEIDGDMYINVEFYDVKTNKLVNTDQHILNKQSVKVDSIEGKKPIRVSQLFDFIDIEFDCGVIRFNTKNGMIERYKIGKKEIIIPDGGIKGKDSIRNNFYRPFIRNLKEGIGDSFELQLTKFDTNYINAKDVELTSLTVEMEYDILSKNKPVGKTYNKYIIYNSGVISLSSRAVLNGTPANPIDCFGIKLKLNRSFGNIIYYGKGNTDNYPDLDASSKMGIYTMYVDRMFNMFKTAQECGNRKDVHFAIITDIDGDGIAVNTNNEPFNLRVMPCSDAEILENYKANKIPEGVSGVYVDVDSALAGIGEENKGRTDKKFELSAKDYEISFNIIPIRNVK
ncbi:MAG: hypothetical protein K5765_01920 [Clostridia bacterium]|nr:hypothetical protein [Clostridia bacterium]